MLGLLNVLSFENLRELTEVNAMKPSLSKAEEPLQESDQNGHCQAAEEDHKDPADVDDVEGRGLAEVLYHPTGAVH